MLQKLYKTHIVQNCMDLNPTGTGIKRGVTEDRSSGIRIRNLEVGMGMSQPTYLGVALIIDGLVG